MRAESASGTVSGNGNAGARLAEVPGITVIRQATFAELACRTGSSGGLSASHCGVADVAVCAERRGDSPRDADVLILAGNLRVRSRPSAFVRTEHPWVTDSASYSSRRQFLIPRLAWPRCLHTAFGTLVPLRTGGHLVRNYHKGSDTRLIQHVLAVSYGCRI